MIVLVSKRRVYKIKPIVVNGLRISEVIIDPHYEEKHRSSIDDNLILSLVKEIDGRFELPATAAEKYLYFATLVAWDDKQYRLIWLLEEDAIYIGVVNAYRDKRRN